MDQTGKPAREHRHTKARRHLRMGPIGFADCMGVVGEGVGHSRAPCCFVLVTPLLIAPSMARLWRNSLDRAKPKMSSEIDLDFAHAPD